MASFTGKHRIDLELVASTNAYAWQLLQQDPHLPEGTVITAYHQYAGRGQRIAGDVANEWHSEPGQNITTSIIYYPRFVASTDVFVLNKVVALALVHTLLALLPAASIHIKWPNDILVLGRKVAGLLIDNSLNGARVAATIIGIGLNVNQIDFQPNVRARATSLRLLTSQVYSPNSVLTQLIEALEHQYLRLRSGAVGAIDREYLHYLYRYQEWAPYRVADETIEGMIVGISDGGQLALQQRNQATLRYFNFKEIQFT